MTFLFCRGSFACPPKVTSYFSLLLWRCCNYLLHNFFFFFFSFFWGGGGGGRRERIGSGGGEGGGCLFFVSFSFVVVVVLLFVVRFFCCVFTASCRVEKKDVKFFLECSFDWHSVGRSIVLVVAVVNSFIWLVSMRTCCCPLCCCQCVVVVVVVVFSLYQPNWFPLTFAEENKSDRGKAQRPCDQHIVLHIKSVS